MLPRIVHETLSSRDTSVVCAPVFDVIGGQGTSMASALAAPVLKRLPSERPRPKLSALSFTRGDVWQAIRCVS